MSLTNEEREALQRFSGTRLREVEAENATLRDEVEDREQRLQEMHQDCRKTIAALRASETEWANVASERAVEINALRAGEVTVRSTGVPELVEALKQENAALRDRVENDRKKYEMVCKHADEQVATLRAELSVERDYRKAANETEAALRAELDKRKAYESTFHKTLGELRTELTTHAIHRFCVSRTKYDALRAQLEALRDEGRRNRVELQKELDALRDEAEELNAALTTKDDEWIVSQGYQALVEAARDFVGYCDNCGGTGKVGDSDCRWCTPTRAALKAIEERR